jgi:hypothetical protein
MASVNSAREVAEREVQRLKAERAKEEVFIPT